jgi:hypothetical protein
MKVELKVRLIQTTHDVKVTKETGRSRPVPLMNRDNGSFHFRERSDDFNRFTPAREYGAAGEIERQVLLVVAGELRKPFFGNAVNHSPHVAPIDGARAHRARLSRRIQSTGPEHLLGKTFGRRDHQRRLRVPRAVVFSNFDIALLQQHLAVRIHQDAAESRIAGLPRATGYVDAAKEITNMLFTLMRFHAYPPHFLEFIHPSDSICCFVI